VSCHLPIFARSCVTRMFFIQHLCYLGQNTEKAFVDGEFVSLACHCSQWRAGNFNFVLMGVVNRRKGVHSLSLSLSLSLPRSRQAPRRFRTDRVCRYKTNDVPHRKCPPTSPRCVRKDGPLPDTMLTRCSLVYSTSDMPLPPRRMYASELRLQDRWDGLVD
jgi:hypothetical protein